MIKQVFMFLSSALANSASIRSQMLSPSSHFLPSLKWYFIYDVVYIASAFNDGTRRSTLYKDKTMYIVYQVRVFFAAHCHKTIHHRVCDSSISICYDRSVGEHKPSVAHTINHSIHRAGWMQLHGYNLSSVLYGHHSWIRQKWSIWRCD